MTLLLIIFNKLEVVIVKFYTAMEFFIPIWIKDDEKRKILWHKAYPKQQRKISCIYKDGLADKKGFIFLALSSLFCLFTSLIN
jgi:hypothetical protein